MSPAIPAARTYLGLRGRPPPLPAETFVHGSPLAIVRTGGVAPTDRHAWSFEHQLSSEDILQVQKLVSRVPISDQVLGYAHALVRATRPGTPEAPEFVTRWLNWGAGPRGGIPVPLP